jgi:ATP-dependent Clp protease, protease subunit
MRDREAVPMGEIPGMLDQVARVSVAQKLFDARSVVICGEIDSDLARTVVEQFLALSSVSNDDVTLYLHSPGGHVEAADTIYDMLGFIRPRVTIIGTGWVASAGAHIYLGVPREQRYCLPNTRFLLHQPAGGAGGRATDLEIEAEEILKMRARLNRIIAEQTGQPLKRVEKDTERNFWMSAEAAKEYGLVGKIIASVDDLKR